MYAALRGDPSDNLPGVPGVGEKTAAKLINDYGDLDGVFANLEKCTPKLRANLAASEARVRDNAKATPLVRDVPIECDVADLRMGGWDAEEVHDLFTFLEFRTLWDRLLEATAGSPGGGLGEPPPCAGRGAPPLDGPAPRADAIDWPGPACRAAPPIAGLSASWDRVAVQPHWAGPPARSQLLGIAVAANSEIAYWIDVDLLIDPAGAIAVRELLDLGPLAAHQSKELIRGLAEYGVDVRTLLLDTAIAAYLIDPAETQYLLDDLAQRYAGIELRSPDAPPPGQLDLTGTVSDPAEEAARRAAAIAALAAPIWRALSARGLTKLYDEIERPLVRVLARMEQAGVRVDDVYLRDLVGGLTEEARKLDGEIQELAGHPFTVNSTKQLRTVLFDELGLAPQKKTKTGLLHRRGVAREARGPAPDHRAAAALPRGREAALDLRRVAAGRGGGRRAHPRHLQPDRGAHRSAVVRPAQPAQHPGPHRRRSPVPPRSSRLSAARFSWPTTTRSSCGSSPTWPKTPGWSKAFTSGQDIHETTAARIYGVAPADVTLGMRSKAKMVSYGLRLRHGVVRPGAAPQHSGR